MGLKIDSGVWCLCVCGCVCVCVCVGVCLFFFIVFEGTVGQLVYGGCRAYYVLLHIAFQYYLAGSQYQHR